MEGIPFPQSALLTWSLLPFFVYLSYNVCFKIIHYSLDPIAGFVFLFLFFVFCVIDVFCPGPSSVFLIAPESHSGCSSLVADLALAQGGSAGLEAGVLGPWERGFGDPSLERASAGLWCPLDNAPDNAVNFGSYPHVISSVKPSLTLLNLCTCV